MTEEVSAKLKTISKYIKEDENMILTNQVLYGE